MKRQHERRFFRAALVLPLLAVLLGISASASADGSAAPWRGRESEIEEILLHGDVVSSRQIGHGITNPSKLVLEHRDQRLAAVWKPIDPRNFEVKESYQAEIAAYRLSRHIGLDMVPPTVERRIGHARGSLQMWVDDHRLFAKVVGQQPPRALAWSRLVARMLFFDELIDNPDRNAGNYLVSDDWQIVLIDHSRALAFDSRGPARHEKLPVNFDPVLVERIRALDLEELEALLGDILSQADIKNLLRSRDRLLAYVETLQAERGTLVYFRE